MRRRDRIALGLELAAAAAVAAACRDGPAAPAAPVAPVVAAAAVARNPNNALGALVSVRAVRADSVALRFHLGDGDAAANDSVAPAVRVAGDSAVVPVLGLLPARQYLVRAVVYGPGGIATSDSLSFTTDTLPSDLPRYVASGSDPSPGYVVFAAGRYGVVIDNTGRVVWYRAFAQPIGLSFMAEPNGRFVLRPQTPDPADLEPWVEVDALGNLTRTLGCALGLQPRPHDLIGEADGGYWIMCDETRVMDLGAVGGVAGARVTGTVVQHIDGTGSLRFSWSPFDHFAITDVDPAERTGPTVNWTHGNALDLDASGNLLVSFRNLNEITKIDVTTGAVLWRLGGRRNQFDFVGTAAPPFAHQHGLRTYGAGALLVLDNLWKPTESRSERYALDEAAHTATLVQAYEAAPPALTEIGGSVQSLAGGRTLVSFGTAGRVEEYDATGRTTWRITGNAGYVFRAQRIRSLYAPGVGGQR